MREATPADAGLLHRMAQRLHLEGRDWNVAQATGFLLYAGSEEEYLKTVTNSPYCYVATYCEDSAGFLTTMMPDQVARHPSLKTRALFVQDGCYPLVLEQIGVLPDFQGRGIGQALLDRMLADWHGNRIVATIVLAPLRNERSIRFLSERNGWRQFREVRTSRRLWGFYEYRRT